MNQNLTADDDAYFEGPTLTDTTVFEVERLNNTLNGNPRFSVVLENQGVRQSFKTKPDTAGAGALDSDRFRMMLRGALTTFHLTVDNEIWDWTITPPAA